MCAATPGFLAAFVLVRCAYYTARAATPHSTLPECVSSNRLLRVAVFLLSMQALLFLQNRNGLNMEDKDFVFRYCHSSACENQISRSLDCTLLRLV